MSFWILLRIM